MSWQGVESEERESEEDPNYHGTRVEGCLNCYTILAKTVYVLIVESMLDNRNVPT